MKTLKMLAALALTGMLLPGCSGLKITPPTICTGVQQWVDREGTIQIMQDPQETAICKIDPWWSETETALFAVNAFALKNNKYKPADVYRVIDGIRDTYYNTPGITVAQLATYAAMQLSNSPELFIASKTLGRYQTFINVKMDDYSWYHINRHLQDQELLAKMYE